MMIFPTHESKAPPRSVRWLFKRIACFIKGHYWVSWDESRVSGGVNCYHCGVSKIKGMGRKDFQND